MLKRFFYPILASLLLVSCGGAKEKFTVTVGDVSFDMVRVKAGTFTMGCTAEQAAFPQGDWEIEGRYDRAAFERVHEVTISKDFFIGETEVTQALYEAVMGENPSGFANGGLLPVETVSYNDAMEFCRRLSEMTGRTFTLPTEAQWEYAARGGHKAPAEPTVFAGSANLDEVGWYMGNAEEATHEVATLKPNALGLYDMTGNVWEWCRDWWNDDFGSDPVTDPEGPSEGTKHVDRGGSWNKVASHCRLSFRYGLNPDYKANNLGFRVVCVE